MLSKKPTQYDTLLRVRAHEEDIKKQSLAEARQQAKRAAQERDGLLADRQHALVRASELTEEQFDSTDVRRYYQYERHLATLVDERDASIREWEGIAEERRGELIAAARARQVVEKVKERKWEAYHAMLRKEEQNALDESASNYRYRQRKENAPEA
jgi:flagellar export protein FliJ